MEQSIDELLGSLCRAAWTGGGSSIRWRIGKVFRKICRKHRYLRIVNQQGGIVNLFFIIDKVEQLNTILGNNATIEK